MQPSPTDIGDSLTMYEKESYSHILNNHISTYRLNETDHNDSTKKDVIIDSNVFVSLIGNTGKIITRQIAKARFKKPK